MNIFSIECEKSLVFILISSWMLWMGCSGTQGREGGFNTEDDYTPLYIGTYTEEGKSEGIYLTKVDTAGGWQEPELAASIKHPSFVYVTSDRKNLYAVSELFEEGVTSGQVYAYKISDELKLTLVGVQSSGGLAPCHLSMDGTENLLFVTNYAGGVVKVFRRLASGGLEESDSLNFQAGADRPSHVHSTVISPDSKYAYIPDKGLDKIWSFRLGQDSLVATAQKFVGLDSGAGPRHFAFHPQKPYAYVINELDNTINTFGYDETTGYLTDIQKITTLPDDYQEQSYGADIHIHPGGKYLYASNRGHNSIALFHINENNGELQLIQLQSVQGDFPRNFTIAPDGKYLFVANQRSNNIIKFEIDQENGHIAPFGKETVLSAPVCLAFPAVR